MSAPYKAAAIQFEPHFARKERNIEVLLGLVEEAAKAGARLVTTPEMGTTGYCWHDRHEVREHVEPVPGPTTDRFAALARAYDCFVVVGMPEVDPATDLYYNSAVLIGPDGVVGVHRKTHPYISEPKWAASGDLGHQVFETSIGRIALLVCMDIHFIETARLAALGGADVICHISNWLAERAPAPYWISRAFENGCYLMESNRWGMERGVQFSGGSCIIGPDAEMLAVIDGGDGIAYATIDPRNARRRLVQGEPVMEQRRPELYAELMTNTFSWNPNDFFRLYGHEPIPSGRNARIAVAETAPSDDLEANMREIAALAERAKQDGAELVVFPERALTGLEEMAAGAVESSHPALATLQELADRLGLFVIAGYAGREGTTLYNSAVVAGPDGFNRHYRQIHLNTETRAWASAGDSWLVCDLPFGRLGVLVGHDAAFPEAARVLALRGCDLIACPSAVSTRFHASHDGTRVSQPEPIPTGPDLQHWHHYRVRAGENNCYFAFANVHAPEKGYHGLGGIFGPETFAFPRKETIVTAGEQLAALDIALEGGNHTYPTNVVRRKDLVLMRQPHHYKPLIARSPLPR
ncbi:MAG: nitrilase-related carbon-nitrogen hydrolase [Shinella sp.]|nr:nitrilase-related carbon-nitrogen hydrolase [Shinella sp.]